MGIVKFIKIHSINKVGSIAEYDKVLCDKLIDRGICKEASESDIKADKEAKEQIKEEATKAIDKAKEQAKILRKLHSPINLKENKKAIAIIRKQNITKAKADAKKAK